MFSDLINHLNDLGAFTATGQDILKHNFGVAFSYLLAWAFIACVVFSKPLAVVTTKRAITVYVIGVIVTLLASYYNLRVIHNERMEAMFEDACSRYGGSVYNERCVDLTDPKLPVLF